MDTEKKIDFILCDHVPDEKVQLASDLGQHAAMEAMNTLGRVLRTAPGDCHAPAAAVAHAELIWRIGMITEQMDKAAPGFAAAVEDMKAVIEKHSGEKFRREVGAMRKALFGK
jgi:hypothetical protein